MYEIKLFQDFFARTMDQVDLIFKEEELTGFSNVKRNSLPNWNPQLKFSRNSFHLSIVISSTALILIKGGKA